MVEKPVRLHVADLPVNGLRTTLLKPEANALVLLDHGLHALDLSAHLVDLGVKTSDGLVETALEKRSHFLDGNAVVAKPHVLKNAGRLVEPVVAVAARALRDVKQAALLIVLEEFGRHAEVAGKVADAVLSAVSLLFRRHG